MNRQVNYIIYAVLLFLTGAGSYYIISEAPLEIISINENKGCGTKDVSISLSGNAIKGKAFFYSKCASCHQIFKHSTGPALMSLEQRGPWNDRNEIYKWIKNPSLYIKTNKYTEDLKVTYGSMMQSFPDITNEEIDAIVDYINFSTQ